MNIIDNIKNIILGFITILSGFFITKTIITKNKEIDKLEQDKKDLQLNENIKNNEISNLKEEKKVIEENLKVEKVEKQIISSKSNIISDKKDNTVKNIIQRKEDENYNIDL